MIKAVWAILFPDGGIIADSNFVREDMAWRCALGWPSDEEIERAKDNGHRAVLLAVDVDALTAKPVEHHETEKTRFNVPQGWALLPTELTAENGMKAALMGEFQFPVSEVGEDGNDHTREVVVPWETIKLIYRAVLSVARRLPAPHVTKPVGWMPAQYQVQRRFDAEHNLPWVTASKADFDHCDAHPDEWKTRILFAKVET